MVAMRSIVSHESVAALPVASFCRVAPVRISSNMSRLLLLRLESVPRATVTPRASSSGTGAIPEASFMLLLGL